MVAINEFAPWLYLIVPWAGFFFFWHHRWFGVAQFMAVCGTIVLGVVAAYYWQVYNWIWAMIVPFVAGMAAVRACARAKGEDDDSATWTALSWVGTPIVLMLVSFNYFHKMFLLVRADSSVRQIVRFPGQIQNLPPEKKDAVVRGLADALARNDPFVKWGAVHLLWLSGPAAAPAADAVARALVVTPNAPPTNAMLRVDGVRFLGSLGIGGGPALLIVLREGDQELQKDAIQAISTIGPPLKALALPELAKLSGNAPQDLAFWITRARETLGITEEEWRQAQAAVPPR